MYGRTLAATNTSRCGVNVLVDAHANSVLNSACPCHFDYGESGDPDTLLPSLDDEEAEKVIAGFVRVGGGKLSGTNSLEKGMPSSPQQL